MPAIHLPQTAGAVAGYVELVRLLESRGYDGIWIGEVNDVDAVTAGAISAVASEHADVGVLLNVFTRAPAALAMTASALAHLAPRRMHVVLGVASPLLVERWNGIAYRQVNDRLRDVLTLLRATLTGARSAGPYRTFASDGFSLPSPPRPPPRLLVAACGPRALHLAATEADGVVLNWVTVADLDRIDPLPAERSNVSLVVPVCPTDDRTTMASTMRPVLADYLQAPAYADQQRRLGRAPALEPLWAAWQTGDRRAARDAVADEVLDELVVWGSPDECRSRVRAIEREGGCRAIVTLFPPDGVFETAALDFSI